MPNHRENLHIAKGQREFKPDHFADRNFHPQHGGDPGFAEVHGVTPNHRAIAGIDANIYFQLETAMASSFHDFVSLPGSELTAHSQDDVLLDQKLRRACRDKLLIQSASSDRSKASAKGTLVLIPYPSPKRSA